MKLICDTCRYAWLTGLPGNKQHIWCCKNSRVIKNIKMKRCQDYKEATEEEIKKLRRRKIQGKGKQ